VQVGCGGAALDFLASVETFPQPDDKIRTTELQVSLAQHYNARKNGLFITDLE